MLPNAHLFLQEVALAPSAELSLEKANWRLLRIAKGVGYWINGGERQELGENCVVLISPKARGVIRASQLGTLEIQHFLVDLELLSGVLTVEECHFFQSAATQTNYSVVVCPPDSPVAQEFRAQCVDAREQLGLAQRCRMLGLFVGTFPKPVGPPPSPQSFGALSVNRFKEIITKLPEKELLKYATEDLARMCGCSARHFSRLFRAHFGYSYREKRTKLRMAWACQLLRDTDAKIINVALDSGYHHLGLFNNTFKKHFGLSPSLWRQRNRRGVAGRRAIGVLAWVALMGLLCFHLLAADSAPPASAPAGTNPPAKPLVFEVMRYDVQGNTILPNDLIEKIMSEYTGKEVTFETIRKAAMELQLAYRGRGFSTVAVTLPRQELSKTNRVVKVQVMEGRLAEIEVTGNRFFSSNNVLRQLPSLRTNILLNSLVLQQELDRANVSRDRTIYPQLSPGAEPGTSKLTLKVKDRLPLHGRLELNNYSTPGTPELRMNSSLQYNNLWQRDHQAGFQYSFTHEDMKSRDLLPWRFFDQPRVASYSAFYRLPLDLRNDRLSRNYSFSDFGYDEVTKRFRPPALGGRAEALFYASRSYIDSGILTNVNLQTATGTSIFTDETFQQNLTVNENLGARFIYPLPDVGHLHSSLSFGLDFKSYRLSHYETNVISDVPLPPPPPAVAPPPTYISNPVPLNQPVRTTVDYLPLSLSWEGYVADKWGSTTLSLNNGFHFAGLLDGAEAFRQAAYSRKARGTYYIGNYSVTRDQLLYGEWTLRLRAEGQWASQPLISNEQFGLGGLGGPRGYRDGQEYGDTGWRLLFEPRTPYVNIGMVDGTKPMVIRGSVYADYGERYLLDNAPGRDHRLSLWGAGLGISVAIADRMDMRFGWGWALESVPGVRAGSSRGSFSISIQF